MESNAAVLSSINNLLLYRTFEAISHHKQTKEIDYPYTPLTEGFLDSQEPPVSYGQLEGFEDAMGSSGIVNSAVSSSASVDLAAKVKPLEPHGVEYFGPGLMTRKTAAVCRLIALHPNEMKKL